MDIDSSDAPRRFRLSLRHYVALAVCALLLLVALAVLAGLLFGSSPTPPFIKDTEVYKLAFSRLQASKAIDGALGLPVDQGSFFKGSIEDGEKSGLAKFSVLVTGAKGRGTFAVDAVKADGVWKFGLLELTPESSINPLNLLLEASPK